MKRRYLTFWGSLCWAGIAAAAPISFTVSHGGSNLIRFESNAPLETVVGTTDQVRGLVVLDPANLSAGVSAEVTVEAASIKTGNGTRDGHMRDNHLQTKQYPDIVFKLKDFPLDGVLEFGQARTFEVAGDFSLHGVTRSITLPVEVTFYSGETGQRLHVKGNFEVKLADYSIPRPQFLVMRLDEVQRITVDFWGEVK